MRQALPLHAPSNNCTPTTTNVASSYSPISTTNPNPNYATTAHSPMTAADSSSTAPVASNEENICPLTGLVANSVVSPKRMRRFVRKPLADITNHFHHTIPSSSADADAHARALTLKKKMFKRKAAGADEGIGNDAIAQMSFRSKMLRISFR